MTAEAGMTDKKNRVCQAQPIKRREEVPMSQKNKKGTYYPKGFDTFRENSGFYEELAILKAQETIAELMKDSGTTRTELAKALNQSKAHVTELLSDGRNLTLRTFGRVCFHLKAEVDFHAYKIGTKKNVKKESLLPL